MFYQKEVTTAEMTAEELQVNSYVVRFLKQHNVEPLKVRSCNDPEGGTYLVYEVRLNIDEYLAFTDKYIEYLIDNEINNITCSASFRCV